MDIRRAALEDARSIAEIHVRAWQEAYRGIVPEEYLRSLSIEEREIRWRDILRTSSADTWIAEDAGRVLGWMSLGSSRDADAAPDTGELWAIYVAPEAWRSGVGKALWQHAEAELRRAEFESVTLWVLAENQRAQRFYESLGFSVDPGHEQTLERGGARLLEIRMRRPPCG